MKENLRVDILREDVKAEATSEETENDDSIPDCKMTRNQGQSQTNGSSTEYLGWPGM